MEIIFECTYCGYKWTEVVYNQYALKDKLCINGKCFSKRLIATDVAKNVDYYVGCPPFPSEEPQKTQYDPSDTYSYLRTD